MKKVSLTVMKTVMGRPFPIAERDSDGNPIFDPRLDAEGNIIKQIPRDKDGNPAPNTEAEPIYQNRTREMGKESLLMLLQNFYMQYPQDKLTRKDSRFADKMMMAIDNLLIYEDGNHKLKDGADILELDEDVHGWIVEKLNDDHVGVKIFTVNVQRVWEALDNFERLHEPAGREPVKAVEDKQIPEKE